MSFHLMYRFLLHFIRLSFLISLTQSCYGKLRWILWFILFKRLFILSYLKTIFTVFHLYICSDFLTRSYDIGGVVSVMALSGLYILMTQHGLEYPNFYNKLYALLEPSIFMAKHRAKFFQVSDMQFPWIYMYFMWVLIVPTAGFWT